VSFKANLLDSFIYCVFSPVAIAIASSHGEIMKDWQWLEHNLMETLGKRQIEPISQHLPMYMIDNTESFEDEDQTTDFLRCKIESLLANNPPEVTGDEGWQNCRSMSHHLLGLQGLYIL
jgi:hypothetical protein